VYEAALFGAVRDGERERKKKVVKKREGRKEEEGKA